MQNSPILRLAQVNSQMLERFVAQSVQSCRELGECGNHTSNVRPTENVRKQDFS